MQEGKNSMASDRKLAQAVGGKSVRACDNCVKNRARWYCAADDAFLCDSCDSSVHSANPLARRHERVRLKIPSSWKEKEDPFFSDEDDEPPKAGVPSWHKGFTRKARTPRQKKNGRLSGFPAGVVPEEVCCEDAEKENEEQLLYRVPVFNVERNYVNGEGVNNTWRNEVKAESEDFAGEMNGVGGILSPELDLNEFAADVESLLEKGLDDMELGLGIFGQDEECCLRVKDEDEEIGAAAVVAVEEEEEEEGNLLQFEDLGREGFELNFDCYEEEEGEENKRRNRENKALLKLDYDRVMSAWDYKMSPWMTGERPEFSSGDWLPDYFPGTSRAMHPYGHHAVMAAAAADRGREARVSRYREKRRTRLFSKKIRYEVRKLNAEKRPRMKGRFVKRATFAPSAFPFLNK